MEKHYKIINGKRESSEGKEKTEQKLRPTMKKELHTSYEIKKKTTKNCVQKNAAFIRDACAW